MNSHRTFQLPLGVSSIGVEQFKRGVCGFKSTSGHECVFEFFSDLVCCYIPHRGPVTPVEYNINGIQTVSETAE